MSDNKHGVPKMKNPPPPPPLRDVVEGGLCIIPHVPVEDLWHEPRPELPGLVVMTIIIVIMSVFSFAGIILSTIFKCNCQ